MNIIVLIKQVPNTTEVILDPKTGNLIREGLDSIINPDDLHALEVAVTLKESYGGKVTALSMGPPQAIDALSEAMGMGADKAILLSDPAFAGADTWATSFTLGKAIEAIGDYDLILCGRQAIDGDTAQVGPQVAEYMDLPQVTYVCDIEKIENDHMVVKRRLEDGYERIKCGLPALLTVIGEINTPRYPHMAGLLLACREKAPIKIWNAADIGVTTAEVGLEGSLTHVIKTFAPKFERKGELLEGDTVSVVSSLLERFKENNLV
ncbi:MAG: electron transfer flavoprotein subunit beta/FixA family protein [Deltaproteobacteria bacterium]|nr:electron transfer flavoprotein subunit beta/FixA family protein [Deltaproteobacteria bacterium]